MYLSLQLASTQLSLQSPWCVSISSYALSTPSGHVSGFQKSPLKPLSRSLRVNVYNPNIPTPFTHGKDMATHTTILSPRSFAPSFFDLHHVCPEGRIRDLRLCMTVTGHVCLFSVFGGSAQTVIGRSYLICVTLVLTTAHLKPLSTFSEVFDCYIRLLLHPDVSFSREDLNCEFNYMRLWSEGVGILRI